MAESDELRDGVSPQTDELASTLMGDALDMLAAGDPFCVLLAIVGELEFGERGWRSYSAYSLVDGIGTGDGFTWTDPAPAGEVPPLL